MLRMPLKMGRCKLTGYYPADNPMEGGYRDRWGNPLRTLQQFLAGAAPYVSVAADELLDLPPHTRVEIPALDQIYGRPEGDPIVFRIVDCGEHFRGLGLTALDICVRDRHASLDPAINQMTPIVAHLEEA